MKLALAVWAFVSVLAACGSSGPAWHTYQSAACDATFDLDTLPASNRIADNTYFGDSVAMAHGIDRPDGSRLVYGCRWIPPLFWQSRGVDASAVAGEVLDGELATFDASWTRGPIERDDDGALKVTLTSKEGVAEVRMRGYLDEWRTHGSVLKNAGAHDKQRFLAGLHVDPPPHKGPVVVRSAECLSMITMPDWPSGDLTPPVVTHRYSEGSERQWQLRCVFLGDSEMKLTPAELFTAAAADTVRGTTLALVSKDDVEVDGRPGRDMRFESADKTRAVQVRVVIDGDRLQAATYDSPNDAAGKDEAVGVQFTRTLHLLRPKP